MFLLVQLGSIKVWLFLQVFKVCLCSRWLRRVWAQLKLSLLSVLFIVFTYFTYSHFQILKYLKIFLFEHLRKIRVFRMSLLWPKCHFVLGLPSGSPEIPIVGTPTTLGPHTFMYKPSIKWGLKKSSILRQDLSNGMSHATCIKGNRGDSPNPSFGHNLCF
jgi:hypothetical protein